MLSDRHVQTFQRNPMPQSGYTMADGGRGSRFLWNIDLRLPYKVSYHKMVIFIYVYLTRCHNIRWLFSSTVKTGAADTPETSVHIPRNTWSYDSTQRRTSEAHPTTDQLLLKLGYGFTHMTCRKSVI